MKKVLIVDDSPEDLSTMKSILEKEGYDVVDVSDGATALDKMGINEFNLVLVDIQMPTFSGYDLLRLLKEKINKNVKIIFVSILPENEVNMDDIDGFVQKPFSPESLLGKIKEVLN